MKKFFDNKIYLDFYTDNPKVNKYFPIVPTRNHLPDWWKQIPSPKSSCDMKRTMKRCSGFMDFFKNTYTVPLSSEILFNIKDHDYYMEASDGSLDINYLKNAHPGSQRKNFLPEPLYSHVKVPVRWRSVSSHKLDIIVIPPTWNNNPAFVDTISVLSASKNLYYDRSMHWHFILNKQTNRTFTIEANTPMYHFVPITDKKVVIRTHYDPEMYNQITDFSLISSFGFNSTFYKMKRFMDKKND